MHTPRCKLILFSYNHQTNYRKLNHWLLNHSDSLSNSLLIVFIINERSLWERNRLVSSANRIKLRILETLQISFIYNKKKSGPRIDPWGTPHLISLEDDWIPLYSTNWYIYHHAAIFRAIPCDLQWWNIENHKYFHNNDS